MGQSTHLTVEKILRTLTLKAYGKLVGTFKRSKMVIISFFNLSLNSNLIYLLLYRYLLNDEVYLLAHFSILIVAFVR